MNATRHQVSLGALALVLCLALPMGILSLFSPATTGDQIDSADAIFVARVTSLQVVADANLKTVVEFVVEQRVSGTAVPPVVSLSVGGRPAIEVGDMVVAMVGFQPDEILGFYHLKKDRRTLQYDIVTPITGLQSLGVSDMPPVPWAIFEKVIQVRRGEASIDELGDLLPGDDEVVPEDDQGTGDDSGVDGSGGGQGGGDDPHALIGDDSYEPNNTVATASPIFLDPPKVVTGNPLLITGLTLTMGDVDFFGFDGPSLSILHAETRFPEGVTSMSLDTIIGLFDVPTAELLASDDDSGPFKLSRMVVPLEYPGMYAVGVESAPDEDLDFTGDDGTTSGEYLLALELEKASYLSNDTDIIAGVSTDGTFLEDFIGFKEVGGVEVLRVGVPADAWGVSYDIDVRGGPLSFFGGAGDQLADPGFTQAIEQLSFELGSFTDASGFNRAGFAESITLLPNDQARLEGLLVRTRYTMGLNQRLVKGFAVLQSASQVPVENIAYSRVMDVDLFGTGADTFYWKIPAGALARCFPVDTSVVVGQVPEPPSNTGIVTGDMQFAMVGDAGDIAMFGKEKAFPITFVLVTEFVSETDAVQTAVQNMSTVNNVESWVVAVDKDPETGLYAAFGAGIGVRRPD